jgi:oligopeptide/dipeptide ABC transporter ATP-binding protein
MLEVKNLSIGIRRGVKTLTVVDDITFTVNDGGTLGLVGESGCGKSLTALSIPGLLGKDFQGRGGEMTGGEIIFNGRRLNTLSPGELSRIRGREISFVFQEPSAALNPLMRIGAQIAEPLELHGLRDKKEIRRQVFEIMESLGLSDPEKLIRYYPHELSGGMAQRVMIAIAAVWKPRLIIADEPTTALDSDTRLQITALLKQINLSFGSSVLFISHDLEAVRRVCGGVLVMYAGKIVERGTVEDVFSRPCHVYTRLLLGAIPSRQNRGRPLAHIPGQVPSVEEKRETGCPFAPRCVHAEDCCRTAFPQTRDLGGGHRVNCVRGTETPHFEMLPKGP